MARLFKFFAREDGAVTVDWVVLTAAIGLLGIAVQVGLGVSAKGLADEISGNVASIDIMTF